MVLEPNQDSELVGLSSYSVLQDICTNWLHLDIIPESESLKLMPDLILMSADELHRKPVKNRPVGVPTVVVCRNFLIAYEQQSQYQPYSIPKDGLLEFVSQP